jgi:phage tail sheath protein FI
MALHDSDPVNKTGFTRVVSQCETLKYRFAILQSPVTQPPSDDSQHPFPSKRGYAAYYYPWLWVINPTSGTPVLIPPGGHVAGIYARSDTNRGVQKDPANEIILGIDRLQLQTNNPIICRSHRRLHFLRATSDP